MNAFLVWNSLLVPLFPCLITLAVSASVSVKGYLTEVFELNTEVILFGGRGKDFTVTGVCDSAGIFQLRPTLTAWEWSIVNSAGSVMTQRCLCQVYFRNKKMDTASCHGTKLARNWLQKATFKKSVQILAGYVEFFKYLLYLKAWLSFTKCVDQN